MSVSPEHLQKVAEWRDKARNGTLTLEECREGIAFLRAERTAMPLTAGKSKPKVQINGDDLLSELDNL